MSNLLKVGTKDELGKGMPMLSDFDGILSVTNSKRYIPFRSFDHTEKLKEKKRTIKNKYVEKETVLIGNDINAIKMWKALHNSSSDFVLDDTIKDNGTHSVRLHTTETSSYTPQINYAEEQDFSEYDHLHMWIHCSNLEAIDYLNVTFECPDTSNKFAVRTTESVNLLKEIGAIFGHGEITIDKSNFLAIGSPNWSKCKRIYLSLRAKDGEDAIINIANMRMIKRKPRNAKIILRMDDGLFSVYDKAMPIFRKYNVMGSCFVNPHFVATDDSHKTHVAYNADLPAMNLSELHELHDMGWTICSHTWMHNLYQDPTVDKTSKYPRKHYYQAYKDLASVQDWLINNGFGDGATSHVYGNHYYNSETLKASTDIMLCDYSVHPIYDSYSTLPWAESIQHMGAERFCTKDSDGNYPIIDGVIARGGLCVPMFHRFDGDGVDGSVSPETFEEVIQYICSKDGVDIITAADLAYATPVALR